MGARPPQSVRFRIYERADLPVALVRLGKLPWIPRASPLEVALISTIVSELATNIIKYGERGSVQVAYHEGRGTPWVEIVAEDAGPGISDIALALSDHYSTSATLGLGLPAVRRMSDRFAITSAPGRGTTVTVRKGLGGVAPPLSTSPPPPPTRSGEDRALAAPDARWEFGSHTRAMPGQMRGGDRALILPVSLGLLMLMIDVTGHGERAFEVSERIEAAVRTHAEMAPTALLAVLHGLLQGTVGAALGVFLVDARSARFRYVGVGNIRIVRVKGERWRGISRDGVVGARLPTLRPQTGELSPGDLFMLSTDGIPETTGPRYLPNLEGLPPQAMAVELVRRLGKPHDDAGCIIFRWRGC